VIIGNNRNKSLRVWMKTEAWGRSLIATILSQKEKDGKIQVKLTGRPRGISLGGGMGDNPRWNQILTRSRISGIGGGEGGEGGHRRDLLTGARRKNHMPKKRERDL